MTYPEIYELISLFECEPKSPDSELGSFYYQQSTFKYKNKSNQDIEFVFLPATSELTFIINLKQELIHRIELTSIESLTILSDNEHEKRIMLTSESYITKITLCPHFKIDFKEIYRH